MTKAQQAVIYLQKEIEEMGKEKMDQNQRGEDISNSNRRLNETTPTNEQQDEDHWNGGMSKRIQATTYIEN